MSDIKVRATQRGYHDGLRDEGDVFYISAPRKEKRINPNTEKEETIVVDPFAPSWMEKLVEEAPESGDKQPE